MESCNTAFSFICRSAKWVAVSRNWVVVMSQHWRQIWGKREHPQYIIWRYCIPVEKYPILIFIWSKYMGMTVLSVNNAPKKVWRPGFRGPSGGANRECPRIVINTFMPLLQLVSQAWSKLGTFFANNHRIRIHDWLLCHLHHEKSHLLVQSVHQKIFKVAWVAQPLIEKWTVGVNR